MEWKGAANGLLNGQLGLFYPYTWSIYDWFWDPSCTKRQPLWVIPFLDMAGEVNVKPMFSHVLFPFFLGADWKIFNQCDVLHVIPGAP